MYVPSYFKDLSKTAYTIGGKVYYFSSYWEYTHSSEYIEYYSNLEHQREVELAEITALGSTTGASAAVTNKLATTESIAASSISAMQEYIANISTYFAGVEEENITSEVEDLLDNIRESIEDLWKTLPSIHVPDITLEDVPIQGYTDTTLEKRLTVSDITNELTNIQDFGYSSQNILKPTLTERTAPDEVTVGSVATPSKPGIVNPKIPDFAALTIPTIPVQETRNFDVTLNSSLDDVTVKADFNYIANTYSSDIQLALFAKILNDILNGGTGLNVSVEQAIYDRGQQRLDEEYDKGYEELDQKCSVGFPLPQGVLFDGLVSLQKTYLVESNKLSLDIVKLQADLEQKNIQFSEQQGVEVEKMMTTFFNQIEERRLNAAKTATGTAIELINAKITKHNAAVEQYKNEAVVLGEWVKFQTEITKRFLGELDGVKTASEIQKNDLDAQVGTVLKYNESLANVFKTEMEAAEIESKINLSELEQLKVNTEIFLANLEGDKTKVSLYLAQIEGEKNKASIASEQTKTDALRLESQRSKITLDIAIEELKLKRNQQILDEYKAGIYGEQTRSEVEAKQAQIAISESQLKLQKYELDIKKETVTADTIIRRVDTDLKAAEIEMNAAVEEMKVLSDRYIALQKLVASVGESAGGLNAQIAAAALNSGNVSASISDSASKSDSTSDSTSTANNTNRQEGYMYNHNYNYNQSI